MKIVKNMIYTFKNTNKKRYKQNKLNEKLQNNAHFIISICFGQIIHKESSKQYAKSRQLVLKISNFKTNSCTKAIKEC